MERKFKLITSGREEYSQITDIITIEDDSIAVYDAIQEVLKNVLYRDIFTVKNMNDEQLFTEEDEEEIDETGDVFICRWCGVRIPSEQGVYVEIGSDYCHCEDCHSTLYPNEQDWVDLYNEWNKSDEDDVEDNSLGLGCYYWTTAY